MNLKYVFFYFLFAESGMLAKIASSRKETDD